jgi:Protein of unknown function (DUF3168)
MKDIRPALRTFLLADPTISALVGGVRIHHLRLPQDQVAPSIVYLKVSETGDYHLASDSGLSQARIQLDAWAQSSDAATELANAVYDRMTGERGRIDYDATFVDVRAMFLIAGRDDYDEVNNLYRISRDFNVWYAAN